jgi:3-hydroxybutyrate dehydrogenase
MSLQGRTAVITGGGSGIGRAVAQRLGADGAAVVVLDKDGSAAQAVADEIAGARAIGIDLTDLDAVDALDLDADILVNNAGIQRVAPIEEFPPEVFSLMMRLMVESPFRLVRRFLPGMYARGWGRVINISSVHGVRASEFKVAYVTAKHALEGMSKVIALEGAPHGVTSNCINPAYVRTPLVDKQIADQARTHGIGPDEVVEKIMLAPAALKRLLEPAEVAAAASYLCGDSASFITGSSLMIDGGWSIQ